MHGSYETKSFGSLVTQTLAPESQITLKHLLKSLIVEEILKELSVGLEVPTETTIEDSILLLSFLGKQDILVVIFFCTLLKF